MVQQGQVDLQHVQADELWVKLVGPLGLDGHGPGRAVAPVAGGRDQPPTGSGPDHHPGAAGPLLRPQPGHPGLCRWLGQLCHGLPARVPAPVHTGRRGRPRMVLEPGLLLGQVVKRYAQRRVVSVERRVVRGTEEAIGAVLAATNSGTGINTAYIERLNATFRASLAPLVRRGRAIAHTEAVLTAGMWLVGCAYNFCWLHESLRSAPPQGPAGSGRSARQRWPRG